MALSDSIKIVLKRSPDDPEQFSREYQADMGKVFTALLNDGTKFQATAFTMDEIGAVGGATGEVLALAKTLGPAAIAAIGAFLVSRNGRKVRLKVADVETEASTTEEVEKLMALARDYKKAEEPKRIVP